MVCSLVNVRLVMSSILIYFNLCIYVYILFVPKVSDLYEISE